MQRSAIPAIAGRLPDSGRLAFLDSYRLLGIVLVIGIHSFAYVHLTDTGAKLLAIFIRTVAVQIFFLVDGFLFARDQSRHAHFDYKRYVRKSAVRLLLPWLIFSFVYNALRYYFEKTGYVQAAFVVGQSFKQSCLYVYASMIAPQLYFLVSLFLIRCVSYASRALVFARPIVLLAFFLIYSTFYWSADLSRFFLPGQDPVLHAFWGFQYYLFGIILYRYFAILSAWASQTILAALGVALAAQAALLFWPQQPDAILRIEAILVQYGYLLGAFFFFYKVAGRKGFLSEMGQYTMGIYLIHAPIILKISAGIVAFRVHHQVVAYFLIILICFMLSLLITRLALLLPYGGLLFGDLRALQKT